MNKIQHHNSCQADSQGHIQRSQNSDKVVTKTEAQSPDISLVRSLEGKLFVLEERTKCTNNFYQQKIAQLQKVLAKQNETKLELMSELSSLTIENQQQHRYVTQLKTQLQDGSPDKSKLIKMSQQLSNSQEKQGSNMQSRQYSKSRGKLLFSSKQIGMADRGLKLKKCKSTDFIQCEYFLKETQSKAERVPAFLSKRRGKAE